MPSVTCASPSDVPDCSCTCTNGITFNQALSPPGFGPSASPGCQNEKEACLLREQDIATNLLREQETVANLDEQMRTSNVCKDSLTTQLNTANAQLLLKQQQQLKYDEMLAEEEKRRARSFRYQGCYTQDRCRVIKRKYTGDAAMTRQKCAAICKDCLYFALGHTKECWCGDAFHTATELVNDGACSAKCGGDKTHACGGDGMLPIYSK